MRDMRVGEEDATRADDRLAAPRCGPGIHRHPFADQAILADRQPHGFAAIFQILRLLADRGEGKDARARADLGVAGDAHMRNQSTPSPSAASARYGRTGRSDAAPSRAPASTTRARMDEAVDSSLRRHQHRRETSASQTSAPSTLASPRIPPHVAAFGGAGHVITHLVAGDDGFAELHLVDGHEIDDARRAGAAGSPRRARPRSAPCPRSATRRA